MAPKPLPLPPKEELLVLADELSSRSEMARHIGMKANTFTKRMQSEGWADEIDDRIRAAKQARAQQKPEQVAEAGRYDHDDGSATVVSAVQTGKPLDADDLLRAHNIDTAEWRIVRQRANAWNAMTSDKKHGDNRVVTMHQLRIDLVPTSALIAIPDPSDWKPPPPAPKARRGKAAEPRKVVICGDHHCPSHDLGLHAAFLQWLADERPDEGVILGDIIDLPTVSRHRRSKGVKSATVNECLKAAFGVLMDYRHASPDTTWTILPGNHDDRLDHYQIDRAPAAYEIEAADDDVAALSLRRLLHLDELGIELVEGDYNRAKYPLGRKLSLRHGYLAGKTATDKMLAKLSRSVVQGHTHRLLLIYKTEHDDQDDDDPTATRVGAQAGCMCQIVDGLDYADEPDWNQGFLQAYLWPDGDFALLPAAYVPGRLLAPSGKRYGA